jgi:hypothetical protein
MYTLKVKKGFTHSDGRIFLEEHDCQSLTMFEVAELVTDYPDNFEAADALTAETIQNLDNMKHYADAVKRQGTEKSNLKAVKK